MPYEEWLQLALRWSHVFAGILWIGQTYLFTFLDRCFEDSEENPGGEVFLVHSGGFYRVEKRTTLATMPRTLHWFKYEAAYTWLSGLTLLVLVYHMGGLMGADPDQSRWPAIAWGLGAIGVAWIAYDQLWQRALGRFDRAAVFLSYAALVAIAGTLLHVMSARAAYMHVGALMGTVMVANVWERILPSQRRMVAAVRRGETPDPALGAMAKARSKHNTFLVVPVVFTMIASHFPIATYGSDHPLGVLAALIVVGWAAAWWVRRR